MLLAGADVAALDVAQRVVPLPRIAAVALQSGIAASICAAGTGGHALTGGDALLSVVPAGLFGGRRRHRGTDEEKRCSADRYNLLH